MHSNVKSNSSFIRNAHVFKKFQIVCQLQKVLQIHLHRNIKGIFERVSKSAIVPRVLNSGNRKPKEFKLYPPKFPVKYKIA